MEHRSRRALWIKHSRNAEIREACERFSQWCEGHISGLKERSERPTPPTQPGAIWAPLAGAMLMLVVGLVGRFRTLQDAINVMAGELVRKLRLRGSTTKTSVKAADEGFDHGRSDKSEGRAFLG